MIDLVQKFTKYESAITDYVMTRVDSYFDSDCFRKLKGRIEKINQSLDMRQGKAGSRKISQNTWKSNISMPLMLEADINLKAMLLANFANPPIVSIMPSQNSDTPYENALNAQKALDANFKSTKFKSKAFNMARLHAAHYGSFVMVSEPVVSSEQVRATQMGPFGVERGVREVTRRNIDNTPISLLNYFQNPSIPDPELSDFCGFVDRYFFADFIAEYEANKDLFVKRNIQDVIAKGKKESLEDDKYSTGRQGGKDYKNRAIDIRKYFGTININGNEGDTTKYLLWVINDKVVRIQYNPYDWSISPISVGTLAPRMDYWWGNSPIEYQAPYENFGTLFMQMAADEAMRRVENYIFYERGSIDVADWNNRFKMGGMVPVDLKGKQLPHMMWNYQRPDVSMSGTQYMLQEVKEAAQRVAMKSDLNRQGLPGGPQNNTATAASYLEGRSNMVANDIMSQFANGIERVGMINTILLQQYAADTFAVRPNPKEPPIMISKQDILGEFEFSAETSLSKNKIGEAMRLQNVITGLLNFKGSGDPAFQNVAPLIQKMTREWIRQLDLPNVDLETDLPEQIPMQPQAGGLPPQIAAPGPAAPMPEQMAVLPEGM